MTDCDNSHENVLQILYKEFENDRNITNQFIENLHIYLKYSNNTDTKQFVIHLEDIWKYLGVSRKDVAKRFLIKHFEINEDYVVNTYEKLVNDEKRGRNKEDILITVDTFKQLCMMVNTEQGKNTRKYYIKMEKIFFKIIDEKRRDELIKIKNNLENSKDIEIHKLLIEKYKDVPLVYLLRLDINEKNIVKIGETDNIQVRIRTHKYDYPNCVLLNVFPCVLPHKLEQYILHRKDFKIYRYITNEIFKLNNVFTVNYIIKEINKSVPMFNGLTPIENHINKLLTIYDKTDSPDVKACIHKELTKNQEDSKLIIDTPQIVFRDRVVYKYDPTNLKEPIQQFNGISEARRSLNNPTVYNYHITDACESNTVLEGYRWYMVKGDNDKTVSPPAEIPPTEETNKVKKQEKKFGLIAQVNLENTKIIKVFSSQRTAEAHTGIPNSCISISITNKRPSHKYYWKMYEDCSEELKQTYTEELPTIIKNKSCSKLVRCFNYKTGELVKEYPSMQEACNEVKACHKSFLKASNTGSVFRGYIWKIGNDENEVAIN